MPIERFVFADFAPATMATALPERSPLRRLPRRSWPLALLVCLLAPILLHAADRDAALRANNRGVAYMARNEYATAGKQFSEALTADPGFLPARVNLGIAQYAAGQDQVARTTLAAVLKRDPHQIRAHYVLALIAKNHGDYTTSLAELQSVLRADSVDKDVNYYTGFALLHLKRYADAVRYYDKALAASPNDISAIFGLSTCYRAMGQPAKAQVYLRKFIQLRSESKLNTTASLVYGDEGKYALATDSIPPAWRAAPHAVPVKFTETTEAWGIHFQATAPNRAWPGSGVCVFDYDGDGKPDLLLLNGGGPLMLLRNLGGGHFQDVTAAAGLGGISGALACSAGDFNNDDQTDLALTTSDRLLLFQNSKGHFSDVTARAGLAGTAPRLAVAFIDLDHDGYLDLITTDGADAGVVHVYRNLGTGKFANVSAKAAIGQEAADYQGLVATDIDNDRDIDVVLARAHGPLAVYTNNRDGSFTERHPWPADAGADARGVVALDDNHDGWMDLFVTRVAGAPQLLRNVGEGRYESAPLPAGNETIRGGWGATAIDFDNDGYVDLAFIADLGNGKQQLKLYRNLGDGRFADASAETGLAAIPLHQARAVAAADLDGDGAPDLIVTQAAGPVLILRNQGGAANQHFTLTLHGLKDNHTGIGTKLTVRADGLWQKAEITGASGYLSENGGASEFGLGQQRFVDSLGMLWPTGVKQEELPGEQTAKSYTELDRKGGSCPILYAWDGQRFRFIDDLVGPGVIGEWVAPHTYDQPQPSECLKIPAGAALARNGRLEFRFTDQMEEVVYLDRVRLKVVDHPADVDVFSNDKWQPDGPAPAPHLWRVANARPPLSAVDETGHDLLPEVARQDGRYAPISAKSAFPGYVGLHRLTLNLGDLRHAHSVQLLLNGWTEYYFPSTSWTAYHAGIRDVAPRLEIPDGHGGWRVALASIGAPAGLPRTMVVDLSSLLSQFPRGDYQVRLETNLAIYWDQILVSVDAPAAPLRVREVPASEATLRFLGYPRQVRRAPEAYDYNQILTDVGFRRVAGNYTRYGDVLPLLARADDEDVVMASGDEVALSFDLRRLPPLPAGWVRSYFFCANGFTKGDEFLDAHPDTVGPLPYHAAAYPTPAGHSESVRHLRYRLEYNTRHIDAVPADQPGAAALGAR